MTSNRNIGWRRAAIGVVGMLLGLVSSQALACADGVFSDRFMDNQRQGLAGLDLNGDGQAANLYSLIETAKGHGIERHTYLRHIFKELPLAETVEDIDALLPQRFKGGDL